MTAAPKEMYLVWESNSFVNVWNMSALRLFLYIYKVVTDSIIVELSTICVSLS